MESSQRHDQVDDILVDPLSIVGTPSSPPQPDRRFRRPHDGVRPEAGNSEPLHVAVPRLSVGYHAAPRGYQGVRGCGVGFASFVPSVPTDRGVTLGSSVGDVGYVRNPWSGNQMWPPPFTWTIFISVRSLPTHCTLYNHAPVIGNFSNRTPCSCPLFLLKPLRVKHVSRENRALKYIHTAGYLLSPCSHIRCFREGYPQRHSPIWTPT